MSLPAETSKLLALQKSAEAELHTRFAQIFTSHRSIAFAHRDDQLFKEHWTPELAASGYEFAGFENKGDEIVLYGVETSCGFTYRISIAFPRELVDDPGEITAFFQRRHEEALARRKQAASP
jgi:hypothetical protein